MKKKDNQLSGVFEQRKRQFIEAFSREAVDIRESIINDLPAYNILLSLNAQTFEEFAYQSIAEERKEKYDKEHPPTPQCPFCETTNSVGHKEDTIYRCRACDKTFSINHNSITSKTNRDALTWMKVFYCMLNGFGNIKTYEYCKIAPETFYYMRSRLFYAMRVFLDDIKLYGDIQVDNTFVPISFKGYDLEECEFDEDNIFFDPSLKPRDAKKRGRRNKKSEQNENEVCVFAAIDNYGHVLTRFTGIGAANYRSLLTYVPPDKYLLEVPKKDPFGEFIKKKVESEKKHGEASLMIADKEGAIRKYARNIGINFVAHVNRKNNVQRKIYDNKNIQRVNALHRRLKAFLRQSNYVSTKYLPGYLTLFEFIENTGASEKAIHKVFQILAKPSLGKPPLFYEDLFTVPSYLLEYLNSDNPLKKIPPNKSYAFYLYEQFKTSGSFCGEPLTMKEIEEETGYTAKTIRKLYHVLNNAGYRDMIIAYFDKKYKTKKHKEKEQRKRTACPTSINPVVLAIYDEYAKLRKLPPNKRPIFEQFLEEKNKEYGTNYKVPNLYAKFKRIEENNVRDPLPPLTKSKYGFSVEKALLLLEEYEQIQLSYRQRGERAPRRYILLEQVGEKHKFTPESVLTYITKARKIRKQSNNKF